jgi:hypothetical protein
MWTLISGLAASVAVIIAYLQWKTAQTKVVLEIHATRYAIPRPARSGHHVSTGAKILDRSAARKYLDAQSRAHFHFGWSRAQSKKNAKIPPPLSALQPN